jgi:hypothetical protein
MWNLCYRWQRHVRLAAGAFVLVASGIGLWLLMGTAAAQRAGAGARELVGELQTSNELMFDVDVPADLNPRVGTLVYLQRNDGVAQVIGRVIGMEAIDARHIRLNIRLTAPVGAAGKPSGVVLGASAALDLRDAMRLLVSPDSPDEEVVLARDTIWPSVRTDVLPEMIEGLIRETSKELANLDERDVALLASSMQQLRVELQPLEDELVNRLAQRAWDAVGMQGLAAGLLRKTSSGVQRTGSSATQWWWRLFDKDTKVEMTETPFFSEATTAQLRTVLEQETLAFWNEHRAQIVDAIKKVALARRGDFETAFRERWAGLLYERAILPAWQHGQDKVLASVQDYATDFAARRLLTRAGGPRLLFAYALRSSLEISDDPLLIFSPGAGNKARGIVYQPLLR